MGMCESKKEYFEQEYIVSKLTDEFQFTRYLYEKDEVKP